MRSDGGFEDREGHQAPFTLQILERLFCFLNRADDGVEIRPVAGIEFGMDEFAIGANFERAAARRDERERRDALAEFKNLGRQTDGLRRVVSNDAVFDRYLGFHFELLSTEKRTKAARDGQEVARIGSGTVWVLVPIGYGF